MGKHPVLFIFVCEMKLVGKKLQKNQREYGVCPECKIRDDDSSSKKLEYCKYCEIGHCNQHATPQLVMSRYRIQTAPADLKEAYEREFRKSGGHPCSWYDKTWHDEYERGRVVNVGEAIAAEKKRVSNDICDYCKTRFSNVTFFECNLCQKHLCMYHSRPELHHCEAVDWELKKREGYKRSEERFEKLKRDLERDHQIKQAVKYIGAVILIIALLFLFGVFNQPIERALVSTDTGDCSDGTKSGICSANTPYYCSHGQLIYDTAKCGCPQGQILNGSVCRAYLGCSDGTSHDQCSLTKPLFCFDGKLTQNVSVCGCMDGDIADGETCRKRIDCLDGTGDTACSIIRPDYCYNGTLQKRASLCGCPDGFLQNQDTCYDPYVPDTTVTYTWLHNQWYYLNLTLSSKLNEYYQNAPRGNADQSYAAYVTDERQQKAIDSIISQININNSDDRLLTALGLVQSLPYDYDELKNPRQQFYPYQTLFNKRGVCSDKSLLGAAIARRLGYGVALFEYVPENHMTIGIKCPRELSSYGSGFCFLDMVNRCSKLTDNTGDYVSDSNGGTTKLYSTPRIIVISDGTELQKGTAIKDINALKDYQYALQQITKLQQVLSDTQQEMYYATSASEYNSLVSYYNSKVKEYNTFVNVTNEYVYCSG